MKTKILDILYENKNSPVSGQSFAEILGVSRTAVWKHIKSLISDGYSIKSYSGKGYCLEEKDIINEYELKKCNLNIPIFYEKIIDSTNNLAKKSNVESDFAVFIAEIQKNGRGRLGRNFESENNKGVWISFLMKPDMPPEDALIITIASATAVCKTFEEIYGIKAGIKWPNDIILSEKKVCGILSEMSCETNAIDYIVVGIGINVSQKQSDFSKEVSKIATSLLIETQKNVRRTKIISSLCYNMQEIYSLLKKGDNDEIIRRWKVFNITDNKKIKIIKNGDVITVTSIGIDKKGRLIVEDAKGEKLVYSSGEISVRGVMDYI